MPFHQEEIMEDKIIRHTGKTLKAKNKLRNVAALEFAKRIADKQLEQTKPLMTPTWSVSGRVAAIRRVREITGMGLTEAAGWVDLHYQKP